MKETSLYNACSTVKVVLKDYPDRVMRLPEALLLLDETVNPGISLIARLFLMDIYADYSKENWMLYPPSVRRKFVKEHDKLSYLFKELMRLAQKEERGLDQTLLINCLLLVANLGLLVSKFMKHPLTITFTCLGIGANLISITYLSACISISKQKVRHIEIQNSRLEKILGESYTHWGSKDKGNNPTSSLTGMRHV